MSSKSLVMAQPLEPPQTLPELPLTLLVHILVTHCNGADARALACTCKHLHDALRSADFLWRTLYFQRPWSCPPPSFPLAGSWREVFLRSIHFQTLLYVRTLTQPDLPLRMVVPRNMPLNGLKREIRWRQRELDGVGLEDFELVYDSARLGVAGNDAIPPSDLTSLVLSQRLNFGQPQGHAKDAWCVARSSLSAAAAALTSCARRA